MRTSHSKSILIAIIVSVAMCQHTVCVAGEPAYCGIKAMYGAARSIGKTDIEYSDLINPDCVSDSRGSTEEDLVRAAAILGVNAKPLHGLSLVSLTASDAPLVLHVASFGQYQQYNHWELFLGVEENGLLRLVDGDGKVYTESASVLASRWDGTAILVTDSKSTAAGITLMSIEWISKLAFAALAFLLLSSVINCIKNANLDAAASWKQMLIVFAGTLLLTSAVIMLTPVSTDQSRGLMYRSFCEYEPPIVNLLELPASSEFDTVQFIDARYTADFDLGHLPNARSIPINSGRAMMVREIDKLDHSKPVVVYCHSFQCEFDRTLAQQLHVAGVKNLSVTDNGFVEWRDAGLPTESRRK